MNPHPRSASGGHTLVLDLGRAHDAAAAWVAQAAAEGDRLVLAVRDAAWQRDWLPCARALGVPVLALAADSASGLARTVRHALLPLGNRVDRLVLVLDLPLPPALQRHGAAAAATAAWDRSDTEAFLQALQQGCIRLAELAHWCEPALRPGSQVLVLPLQQGHPALRGPGLDTALALSLSSTLRYLAHGLGPRGVQVDLLPPPALGRPDRQHPNLHHQPHHHPQPPAHPSGHANTRQPTWPLAWGSAPTAARRPAAARPGWGLGSSGRGRHGPPSVPASPADSQRPSTQP